MLKLDEPFRYQEIFIISLCQIVEIWGLRVKNLFLQFLVDILPLQSESMDPHIFAYLDPESQNLADPMEPDHKNCDNQSNLIYLGHQESETKAQADLETLAFNDEKTTDMGESDPGQTGRECSPASLHLL